MGQTQLPFWQVWKVLKGSQCFMTNSIGQWLLLRDLFALLRLTMHSKMREKLQNFEGFDVVVELIVIEAQVDVVFCDILERTTAVADGSKTGA